MSPHMGPAALVQTLLYCYVCVSLRCVDYMHSSITEAGLGNIWDTAKIIL